MPYVSGGHGFLAIPAGRLERSTRLSSAPSELPQIFHVAFDFRKLSLNHAFWSAPRMVRGGLSLLGFEIRTSRKWSSAGGFPPSCERPASSAIIASSEN